MTDGLRGLIIVDEAGDVVGAIGKGHDTRLKNLAKDPEWMETARRRRLVPLLLTDVRLIVLAAEIDGGTLLVFSEAVDETVLQFFLSVDFSYDILRHILTDPFEALNIVDSRGNVVYLSPTHEKYLGLQPGQSAGRPVRDVIPNTRLHRVVKTGVSEVGQLQRFKGYERVVSRHPIRHEGEIVGAIGRVMFKGPEQVEMLSQRVNALEQELESYRQASAAERKGDEVLDAIVGNSSGIRSVKDQIRKIAPLDIPVLIQGDSGTGKELVAKALHRLSTRHGGPLVTVNAAALPASLVESELFGYEPGSFTGADRKGRRGKFERADGGTIFLDEIGDMPLEVQTKLLRVLQDRMVERVGGEKPRRIDFRLCCATNHDLELLVEQERFRLDLFYRISPIRIQIPSLEERLEDIPLLVRHFLAEFSEQYARPFPAVDAGVYAYLEEQPWPGNVRQLRHEVERAFVLADGARLRVGDLARTSSGPSMVREQLASRDGRKPARRLKETLEQIEDELIHNAMLQFKGNKKRVADHLGISRSYLYKKLGASGGDGTGR